MTKNSYFGLLVVSLLFFTLTVSGQSNVMKFGDISLADLSNKPYKPDPGADAVILAETGVATLMYQRGFYIEYETDVRIRIVNSNGFEKANIEIPFSVDDKLDSYKASTFNLRDGQKVETIIPKKSFIIERSSPSTNTLKFNFPDVHEGSVIEYSYKMRLSGSSISVLVPWEFQHDIPAVSSSITVVYPDAFIYKSLISGSSMEVGTHFSSANTNFFGQNVTTSVKRWFIVNVPAFRDEPYILCRKEHLTRLTFELQRVDFPDISYPDISPTYEKLSAKLLERWDFGMALKTNFRSLTDKVTVGCIDELSKLKKIHDYVSSKILWNGVNDFTTSSSLRNVMRKEKGNAADINIILIAMLRSAGLTAEPVILSTRSNGTLNEYSAMLQQFDYVVADVTADGKSYLVDATDPLRPFDQLPFECMNNLGRLISETGSKFIDLKNREQFSESYKYNLDLNATGNISGTLESDLSDYSAFKIRKQVKMESEEGYLENIKSNSPTAEISDFRVSGLSEIDSAIILKCNFKVVNGAQVIGDEIILNPYFSPGDSKNPFYSTERRFPVDFGCPGREISSVRLKIPEGYSVDEKPADNTIILGKDDGKFEYICKVDGSEITVNTSFNINKTLFQPSEYTALRDFYEKVIRKESELIILKKNPVIK